MSLELIRKGQTMICKTTHRTPLKTGGEYICFDIFISILLRGNLCYIHRPLPHLNSDDEHGLSDKQINSVVDLLINGHKHW
jgi:hypothetical protein